MSVKKKPGKRNGSKNFIPSSGTSVLSREVEDDFSEADIPVIEGIVNCFIGARPDLPPAVILDYVIASFNDERHSLGELGALLSSLQINEDGDYLQ